MAIRTILVCLSLFSSLFAVSGAVTYKQENGRLGDNLINYLHAKWFSLQHKIPLLYAEFPYSDQLMLSEKEIAYRDKEARKALGLDHMIKVKLKNWRLASKIPFLTFCYKSPYFPEDPWDLRRMKRFSFRVDWKNERFRRIAKEMIAPKKELKCIIPPADSVSVALHFRDGGTYDSASTHFAFPLKFPPLSFYVDGLTRVLALFPNQKIYCYLFTDAEHPDRVVSAIQEALGDHTRIEFAFRKEGNHHDENVLEDFFSFFHFNILIRPQSNFSMLPSLIHDYAFLYAPRDGFVEEGKIVISEVEMVLNTVLYEALKK